MKSVDLTFVVPDILVVFLHAAIKSCINMDLFKGFAVVKWEERDSTPNEVRAYDNPSTKVGEE